MRFNRSVGGSLVSAVKDIDQGTNRADLISSLLALPASGGTPIQETMYEAYSYFAGRSPSSELESKAVATPADSTVDIPSTFHTTASITDPTAITTNAAGNRVFISPISNHCQDNNIILFSDGSPVGDDGKQTEIQNFSGLSCGSGNGECLEALVNGLANKKVNTALTRNNFVYTHTIGFGSDVNDSSGTRDKFLKDASNEGLRPGAPNNSQHHRATDSQELSTVFKSILLSINTVSNDSFVAPAVSVNAYNRLQNRDELYFALFEPNNALRWHGNIKKYRVNANAEILDANDNIAIDPVTGFFTKTAQSIWSDQIDGDEVKQGGFAKELDINARPRKLFASLNSNTLDVDELTLTNFLNKVHGTDTDSDGNIIGDADDINLGAKNDPDVQTNKQNITKWSFGQDVDRDLGSSATDPNFFTGESLHSTPYVLSFGTSAANPRDVVFSTTNQGMLHAINGETGYEEWAYIPDPSLFKNLGDYYNNAVDADHVYGLDGEIAFDVARDPKTRLLTKANLFVGQRRGGSKYFGLSVKDALPPPGGAVPPGGAGGGGPAVVTPPPVKKLWTLQNLPRMGQSWAKPVPARVNYCISGTCAPRDVLFISGGYDDAYDGTESTDTATGNRILTVPDLSSLADTVQGNAIYMIDNHDGDGDGYPDVDSVTKQPKLLWMAGKNSSQVADTDRDFKDSRMVHSFPSEPTVIDADFDGVADLMFAIDIAGRIWRFDFQGHAELVDLSNAKSPVRFDGNDIDSAQNNATSKEVSGGIIADLSRSNRNRKFYNPLDISITPRTKTDAARYNIVTGSGYRAHPLHDEGTENSGETNRLYVVFDRNLRAPKLTLKPNGFPDGNITYEYNDSGASPEIVEESDLNAVTNTAALDPTSTHRYGFYVNLSKGTSEKLINPTITNNFQVVAVSYSPTSIVRNSANNAVCQQDVGSSRLYQVNLLSGATFTQDLSKSGISPKPVVVLINDGRGKAKKVVLVGTEAIATGTEGDGTTLSEGGNRLNLGEAPNGQLDEINWWER